MSYPRSVSFDKFRMHFRPYPLMLSFRSPPSTRRFQHLVHTFAPSRLLSLPPFQHRKLVILNPVPSLQHKPILTMPYILTPFRSPILLLPSIPIQYHTSLHTFRHMC